MVQKKIDSIVLENGLTLDIFDFSRKVAADRWLVKLVARIDIDITDEGFNEKLSLPVPVDQLRTLLGDRICYEYENERNFVGHREKTLVMQRMIDGLMAKKAYYSHSDFKIRFVIKQYHERKLLSACPQVEQTDSL